MFISVSNERRKWLCRLYAWDGKRNKKSPPLRHFYRAHFKSQVAFRKVFEIKTEPIALYHRSHQLAEENCINVCSEVDLSQMEGDKAVRYFCAPWIHLPPVCGIFRGGKHTEQPLCPRNRQVPPAPEELPGAEGTWGYLNCSFQLFATAASQGRNAQFHLLSYSHLNSSVWMPNSFSKE